MRRGHRMPVPPDITESGASPASDAVLAQRCLACLRAGLCRNGMERPRRCLPSSPAPERVAEWSGGMDQRRSQAAPASQVPRDGTACRVLAGPSNTLCRLRRLAGLTALRKTVPAVGEALRAGGRHDVGGERGARVVETSRSRGEFRPSRPSRAPKNVTWLDDFRVPASSEAAETSNGRAWAARGAPIVSSPPRQKAPRCPAWARQRTPGTSVGVPRAWLWAWDRDGCVTARVIH